MPEQKTKHTSFYVFDTAFAIAVPNGKYFAREDDIDDDYVTSFARPDELKYYHNEYVGGTERNFRVTLYRNHRTEPPISYSICHLIEKPPTFENIKEVVEIAYHFKGYAKLDRLFGMRPLMPSHCRLEPVLVGYHLGIPVLTFIPTSKDIYSNLTIKGWWRDVCYATATVRGESGVVNESKYPHADVLNEVILPFIDNMVSSGIFKEEE